MGSGVSAYHPSDREAPVPAGLDERCHFANVRESVSRTMFLVSGVGRDKGVHEDHIGELYGYISKLVRKWLYGMQNPLPFLAFNIILCMEDRPAKFEQEYAHVIAILLDKRGSQVEYFDSNGGNGPEDYEVSWTVFQAVNDVVNEFDDEAWGQRFTNSQLITQCVPDTDRGKCDYYAMNFLKLRVIDGKTFAQAVAILNNQSGTVQGYQKDVAHAMAHGSYNAKSRQKRGRRKKRYVIGFPFARTVKSAR